MVNGKTGGGPVSPLKKVKGQTTIFDELRSLFLRTEN
jgi:hypothetical protein